MDIENEGAYRQKIRARVAIPAKDYVKVTIVLLTEYHKEEVSDYYASRYAVINASLTAQFPPSYEFDIFQSFSTEMRLVIDEDNRRRWELDGAALPHQGFQFFLKKKTQNSLDENTTASTKRQPPEGAAELPLEALKRSG